MGTEITVTTSAELGLTDGHMVFGLSQKMSVYINNVEKKIARESAKDFILMKFIRLNIIVSYYLALSRPVSIVSSVFQRWLYCHLPIGLMVGVWYFNLNSYTTERHNLK